MINLHECQVPVLFHSLNRMVFVLAKLFLTCFLVKLVWTQKPGHFQQNPHVSQFFENAGQVVNSDEESRRRERLLGQARQEIAISFSTTVFCLKHLSHFRQNIDPWNFPGDRRQHCGAGGHRGRVIWLLDTDDASREDRTHWPQFRVELPAPADSLDCPNWYVSHHFNLNLLKINAQELSWPCFGRARPCLGPWYIMSWRQHPPSSQSYTGIHQWTLQSFWCFYLDTLLDLDMTLTLSAGLPYIPCVQALLWRGLPGHGSPEVWAGGGAGAARGGHRGQPQHRAGDRPGSVQFPGRPQLIVPHPAYAHWL